jgi:class 3 adenylate cyclase
MSPTRVRHLGNVVPVARLDPSERAGLPDRAFAYIDSRGRRRLPIHDPAHVRNALARFSQVQFEHDVARERARMRLLNAAKKFKIVPIGFIAGQLQSERVLGQDRDRPVPLPSGFVTMLMTDIEGSTALVHQLGARYRELIDGVWAILRQSVVAAGGCEVEARADEFFAVFEAPRCAVDAALSMQRAFLGRSWPDDVAVRVRIGIHSGYPTSTATNYVGLDVNTASRICAAGHGGQIVVSANTREAVKASAPSGVRFTDLGAHRLRGLPEAVALFQVTAKGLPTRFPPLRATPG